MRADLPVPSCCPLYYWEVEVVDGGEDGSIGERMIKAGNEVHVARFGALRGRSARASAGRTYGRHLTAGNAGWRERFATHCYAQL